MMKKMKNNKLAIASLAALLVVGVVGGTFAYFSQTASVKNEFETPKYDTTIVEKFTPPTEWKPGADVTKEVGVSNTGDIGVAVRVSYQELWTKGDNTLSNTFEDKDGNVQEAAVKTWGDNVCMLGVTPTAAQLEAGCWIQSADGYFYYSKIVNPNETTGLLLKSVKLNEGITPEFVTMSTKYWDEEKQAYVERTENKRVEDGLNYDAAKYELTFTASTVQADQPAVRATWGDDAQIPEVLMNALPVAPTAK